MEKTMNTSTALSSKPSENILKIGINREDRKALADNLSEVLADTYLLYLKTQSFHWNVVGPLFYGLHNLTEKQYKDLASAIDTIAERIRAIGFIAPGSFMQFSELADIKEETGAPSAHDMIEQLAQGHEICARKLRTAAQEADKVGDIKTADLLTERIGEHEESVWMLKAMLA